MARAKKIPFKRWQSNSSDGIEKRYIRLGNTQLLHDATRSLNHLSFRVYVYMLLESGGKIEFTFPRKKYRKWCSNDGFQKAVSELAEKGFIEIVEHNQNRRIANVYRFSEEWKKWIDDTS